MTQNNWDKSLIDYLKEIPDERNAGGRRHPLWLILLIIILGIMSVSNPQYYSSSLF